MSEAARNWKRGGLRLWAVASTVWIAGMGYVQFSEPPKSEQAKTLSLSLSPGTGLRIQAEGELQNPDLAQCDKYFDEKGRPQRFSMLLYRSKEDCVKSLSAQRNKYRMAQLQRLSIVVAPPLILLGALAAAGWIRRGFNTNNA